VKWAEEKNLVLNFKQSVEIVFVLPRSRRDVEYRPSNPIIVQTIKVLDVTIYLKFSVTQHVSTTTQQQQCHKTSKIRVYLTEIMASDGKSGDTVLS